LNCDENVTRKKNAVRMLVGLALAVTLLAPCAGAQTPSADSRPVELKSGQETYQTLYLTNMTQSNEAIDLQTDLRNMLPKAKLFYVSAQSAISIHGSPDDILLAQKIVADLDRPRKIYRLTYTITDSDGGKRIGAQHLVLLAALGEKLDLKQGSKVPIVTGTTEAGGSSQNSQVTYVDIGLKIEAYLEGETEGLRLRTKVEQSILAEEKSAGSVQDPVIRQDVLEETAILVPGKPLVLGSLDLPGSTRKQEIEVVSELVR